MSKHIDQSELSKIIVAQKGVDQKIVDVFIQQLFKGIERKLEADSSIKVDELGLFRIIQSGATKRILFLGNVVKSENKPLAMTGTSPLRDGSKLSVDKNRIETFPLQSRISLAIKESKQVVEDMPISPADRSSEPVTIEINKEESKVAEVPYTDAPVVDEAILPPSANPPGISSEQTPPQYSNIAPRPLPEKKKLPIYIGIGLVAVLIMGTFIYKLVSPSQSESDDQVVKPNFNEARVSRFGQVANSDPMNISCVILVDTDVSVQDLAQLYYGNELFWPYIFEANQHVIDAQLMVEMNTLIKIPKLTVDLVNYSTGVLDNKVKAMGDKIKKELGISEE